MITITGTNVNEVYPIGIQLLKDLGVRQESQHGTTLEMPEPVSVQYLNPRERILFDEQRDSNPFLNFFEALWIIAGRNDVAFLQNLVGRMASFSDDGKTYYGAYGSRIRGNDNPTMWYDQMECAISRLKKNLNDRQVVLTIRRPNDIAYTGKDQPCNLLVSLKIRQGKLNIHVFNRSNDFIWGLTGTNVVQFSMLQEYLAGRIGVPVGVYHQTTDSMHVYVNPQWEKLKGTKPNGMMCPYALGDTKPFGMMQMADAWDDDLKMFFQAFDTEWLPGKDNFFTPFFQDVVTSMWGTFNCYRLHRDEPEGNTWLSNATEHAQHIPADWGLVTRMWLQRRVK
jgi:thymidylate synthase